VKLVAEGVGSTNATLFQEIWYIDHSTRDHEAPKERHAPGKVAKAEFDSIKRDLEAQRSAMMEGIWEEA